MSIQFYNVKANVCIAELDDDYNVLYLHPNWSNAINKQKGVGIPAIKKLTDQFDGLTRIPSDNKLFGKALVIHLQYDYASHPESYKWLSGEELVKAALK